MITPAKSPSTRLAANPHQHLTLVIQKDGKSCTSDSVSDVVPIVRASHRNCDLMGLQLFSDNRVPLGGTE